jgi:iron complex transport system ATP-binding protein
MTDLSEQSGKPLAIDLKGVGVLREDRWLVRDITWQVKPGTCAAILGPNGCGKSTLTRVISGYLWPSTGSVAVDGHVYGEVDLRAMRKSIRLVQAAGPFDVEPELTAREVVLTGLFGTIGLFDPVTPAQVERAETMLKRVGLLRLADRTYATMSSGERVRSLIARALVDPPSLLLLDEPTNGLDLLAREQVLATVQGLFDHPHGHPTTVVMITHHVEELPPATSQVMLMKPAEVQAVGAPAEVLDGPNLSNAYGCDVRVREIEGRYFVHVAPDTWRDLLD